ncbi:MAG: DUF4386 domain-containing protein [Thermomicrobiales bacterium]
MNHEPQTRQRLARLTGFLYLLIAVGGMLAGTVSGDLAVPGDAAATAHHVLASLALARASLVVWMLVIPADVAVAVALYILLKPAGAAASLLAAALRVLYAAIQGTNLLNLFHALAPGQANAQVLHALESYGAGFQLGLVCFGLHLIVLGYLLIISGAVPRVLAVLVAAAGIGYGADNLGRLLVPGFGGAAGAVLLAAAALGELGLTFWLLVKGVRVGAVMGNAVRAHSAAAEPYTTTAVGGAS